MGEPFPNEFSADDFFIVIYVVRHNSSRASNGFGEFHQNVPQICPFRVRPFGCDAMDANRIGRDAEAARFYESTPPNKRLPLNVVKGPCDLNETRPIA